MGGGLSKEDIKKQAKLIFPLLYEIPLICLSMTCKSMTLLSIMGLCEINTEGFKIK